MLTQVHRFVLINCKTLRHQSALILPWRIRCHAAIRGATRWEAVAAAGASTTRPNVVRSSMYWCAFAASLSGEFSKRRSELVLSYRSFSART
jgi:hypothetical protein